MLVFTKSSLDSHLVHTPFDHQEAVSDCMCTYCDVDSKECGGGGWTRVASYDYSDLISTQHVQVPGLSYSLITNKNVQIQVWDVTLLHKSSSIKCAEK